MTYPGETPSQRLTRPVSVTDQYTKQEFCILGSMKEDSDGGIDVRNFTS